MDRPTRGASQRSTVRRGGTPTSAATSERRGTVARDGNGDDDVAVVPCA